MFGLSCMPPEFQLRMEELFRIPIGQGWLIVYIDDGLITSDSWEEHIWQIYIALRTLSLKKIRIAFEKSFFGYPELKYLGHKLNSITIGVDEGRVQAITDWATPRNRADIQSLLGFTGYHRMFIPHYAQIVHELQALVPQSAPWKWTEVEQQAFEAIKKALIEAVQLFYPDWTLPFIIYTDASILGLGAGLYQEQQIDGKSREVPIAFISRQLKGGEYRYGASQLECLAVIWMSWRSFTTTSMVLSLQ